MFYNQGHHQRLNNLQATREHNSCIVLLFDELDLANKENGMHTVNMLEAKSTLSKLVEAIQSGNGNCQASCRLTVCVHAAILSSKSPFIFSFFSAMR